MVKTLGYPALRHEALRDWEEGFSATAERSEGSFGTYWSLHAYPHLVSTQGMDRYCSTSFLLNSVKLQSMFR